MGVLRITHLKNTGSKPVIGDNSTLIAERADIADGVRIGNNVKIVCDSLVLGTNVRIADNVSILSPEIRLDDGCQIQSGLEAELNEYFQLGGNTVIGKNAQIAGQGMACGVFLRVNENVVIGGGGARGPRSTLTVGDYTRIIGQCYINLSEPVRIGSHTALSRNVTILTHGAWQPSLKGFAVQFGPVSIGDNSVLYAGAQVMPNVSVGNFCTIAAGSIVTQSIPDNCLAAGIPAKIKKGPGDYPAPLSRAEQKKMVVGILKDYLTTLPVKGMDVVSDSLESDGTAVIRRESQNTVIRFLDNRPAGEKPDISLSLEPGQPPSAGECHFDLDALAMTGPAGDVAEDIRDHLRRWAIRIETGKPYRSLPLSNLTRLKKSAKQE